MAHVTASIQACSKLSMIGQAIETNYYIFELIIHEGMVN